MKITLCPACKSSSIESLETVKTQDIARVFSIVDPKAGQIIEEYLEKGDMAENIYIDKCRICGLEFANPPFAGDIRWYSQVLKSGMRWDFFQCLKDLPPKPAQILEIGCDVGYFLELATQRGYRVLGIDFNETAVETAQAKGLDARILNIKDLNKHAFDKKFDAVVSFHTIENIDNPEVLLADLSEIMPKGSTLHLSCPGSRRFTTYLQPEYKLGLRDVWDYPPDHQTRWNKYALDRIVSRFGWSMQKYIEEPFNWLGISVYLVSLDCIRKGLKYSDWSWLEWKIRILKRMLQTFIPSLKYKGLSIYCMAIRQ